VDNLDRFNDAVSKVAISWRNIFAFVAFVYVIGTVLGIAGGGPKAWIIISWVIIAIMAVLIYLVKGPRNKTKKELKNIEKEVGELKKELRKVESRPCVSDSDLKQRDEEVKALTNRIDALETKKELFVLENGLNRETV
jgi:Sec-independent protein translocase protein TatA